MSSRNRFRDRARVVLACLFAVGVALAAPTRGQADYVFSVQPTTPMGPLSQGESQSFYVYLTVTPNTPEPIRVSGFGVGLMLTGDTTGVGFTRAGFADPPTVPPPATPYIFGAPTSEYLPSDGGGGPASFSPFATDVAFSDFLPSNSPTTFDFVTLLPGDVRYIGFATLTNVNSSGGTVQITFKPGFTTLFDDNAADIDGGSGQPSGPIILLGPTGPGGDGTPVPAPPMIALWAAGVVGVFGGRFLRTRRRAAV